jgi:imidazolonepropionase-like amidohydrolase
MFSNQDVVKIMTKNAATVIGRGKDLGTLEPGKQADIVMLDGDPLADIQSVLKVRMVIKGGNVVVDRDSPARTSR